MLQLDNRPVPFYIDTGAEVMVIPDKTLRKLGHPTLSSQDRQLRGPDTHTLKKLGKWTGTVKNRSKQAQEAIYEVEGLSEPLIE